MVEHDMRTLPATGWPPIRPAPAASGSSASAWGRVRPPGGATARLRSRFSELWPRTEGRGVRLERRLSHAGELWRARPGLRGHAARLESALAPNGVDHDVVEYPDVSHSFLNHHTGWMAALDRVSGFGYRGAEAEDAWRRIDAFFAGHLAGGESVDGARSL